MEEWGDRQRTEKKVGPAGGTYVRGGGSFSNSLSSFFLLLSCFLFPLLLLPPFSSSFFLDELFPDTKSDRRQQQSSVCLTAECRQQHGKKKHKWILQLRTTECYSEIYSPRLHISIFHSNPKQCQYIKTAPCIYIVQFTAVIFPVWKENVRRR